MNSTLDRSVRAKTYIPTGKLEMIFTMWFRAMLRNVAQESHYPYSLFKSTWLKSVTLSVNYSARRPKGVSMHCGMDFFVFCNNSYVTVLRDIDSIPRLCILVVSQIVRLCTFWF